MRPSIAAAFLVALLLGTGPAAAQWSPPGPLTFARGSTNEISFSLPLPVEGFEAAEVLVRYSPLAFEPLALLPGEFTGLLDVFVGPATPVGGGLDEVFVSVTPFLPPVDLVPGVLFGGRFLVRPDAPLGTTTVFAALTVGDTPAGEFSVDINITPVPEPGTWAMMMAGLALVVASALRRRRTPAPARAV